MTEIQKFINAFNNAKGAQFIAFTYTNKFGETAKRIIQINTIYKNALTKDLGIIPNVEFVAEEGFNRATFITAQAELLKSANLSLGKIDDSMNKTDIEQHKNRSKGQTDAYVKIAENIKYNVETQKIYIFAKDVRKTIITEGEYPSTNKRDKTKAKDFINRYDLAIEADKENCLGSYVFLWAQKQERTPTWYGMFLEDGSKTETVDAMQYIWTGKWPENRCPSIDSFKIDDRNAYDNIMLKANTEIKAHVFFKNYENDSLTFRWKILSESTDLGWGGDFEKRPETIYSTEAGENIEIKAPKNLGAYRLFVYVVDDQSNAATANIPFKVIE